jgi:hypothetical protein
MGGHVFKNTVPFDHKKIPKIKEQIDSVLAPLGIIVFPFGSTAIPVPGKTSGDYDVMVDENVLARKFVEKNPRSIRKKLKEYFDQAGFETTLNGIAVHINVAIDNDHHQADVMVVPNATKVVQFHLHQIPPGSPYKGVHKHLAMSYLARSKGLLWSAFQGLYRRDQDGKRGDFITADLDTIAYLLLGVDSNKTQLNSFEGILSALTKDEADRMLLDLEADPSWKI